MARRGASPRVTECPYYSWESRPTRAVARGDYRGKGHRCLGWTKQGGRRDAYSHNCGTTARVSGWSDTGKRSARKPACCVWGGADGKGLGNQHLASGLLYFSHPDGNGAAVSYRDLEAQRGSCDSSAPPTRRLGAGDRGWFPMPHKDAAAWILMQRRSQAAG